MLPIEGPSRLQLFLDSLNDIVGTFEMTSNCKIPFGSKPNLVPAGEQLNELDGFSYLVIVVSHIVAFIG